MISRTCLGFGAALHLIGPLGFDAGDKGAKRAGLDYWPNVDLHLHDSWGCFERDVMPKLAGNVFLFSKLGKHGEAPLHKTRFFDGEAAAALPPGETEHAAVGLVFGSEQKGLEGVSAHALATLPRVFFPMIDDSIRSYNLSSSVAMGLGEAARQMHEAESSSESAQGAPHSSKSSKQTTEGGHPEERGAGGGVRGADS
jgi:tRNA (cytidine/uridine-2'-O-)-methyltransferase